MILICQYLVFLSHRRACKTTNERVSIKTFFSGFLGFFDAGCTITNIEVVVVVIVTTIIITDPISSSVARPALT
jgi:hypothetical protein